MAALQALRGIAKVSAVTIVAEVGQLSRLPKARQLMGYIGSGGERGLQRGEDSGRDHETGKRAPAADSGGSGMVVNDLPHR